MTKTELFAACMIVAVFLAFASLAGAGLVVLLIIVGVFAIAVADHVVTARREREADRRERLKASARR